MKHCVLRCLERKLLTYHIFSEPDIAAAIYINADTDAMQGCAEQVDTMPASQWLVSHAFLNGRHTAPGRRIRSSHANIFTAVAQASKAFIGNALILGHPIRAGMAEAAVFHVPTM